MFTLPTERKSPWQILGRSLPALKAVWLKCLPIVLLLVVISAVLMTIFIKVVGGMETLMLDGMTAMATGAHVVMLALAVVCLVLMIMWINAGIVIKVESLLFQRPRSLGRILFGSLLRGLLVLLIAVVIIFLTALLFVLASHVARSLGMVILAIEIIGLFLFCHSFESRCLFNFDRNIG